jgi:large subunit ribosomal protein L17
MRHRIKGTKLGKDIKGRKTLFRNLAISLILEEQIKTTQTKAKVTKSVVDSLISKAKEGNLSTRRLLISRLGNQKAAAKLIENLAPRFSDRIGGFTRIIKIGNRFSDSSPMAILQLVKMEKKTPKEIKKLEKEKIKERRVNRLEKKTKKKAVKKEGEEKIVKKPAKKVI